MKRPGGTPTWRLKAVLNVLAEPWPVRLATSSSAIPPLRSRSLATAILHFHARGWTVVLTMRNSREGLLPVADLIPEAYAEFARPIFEEFASPVLTTQEGDVAEAVWLAANEASGRLHYPAGPDAVALAQQS